MHWYTRRSDGTEKGPFDDETLRGALARGELARNTLVRREDEEDWAPIGKGERLSSEPPRPLTPERPTEQPPVPGARAAPRRLPAILLTEAEPASSGLKALAWGMFGLHAAHRGLLLWEKPGQVELKVVDLFSDVIGTLLLVFVISWVAGLARGRKDARTKMQTFLIVCALFEAWLLIVPPVRRAMVDYYREQIHGAPTN